MAPRLDGDAGSVKRGFNGKASIQKLCISVNNSNIMSYFGRPLMLTAAFMANK